MAYQTRKVFQDHVRGIQEKYRSIHQVRTVDCYCKNMFMKLEILLPEEYCNTFRVMYESAPTSGFKEVKHIFESSTGKKLTDVFISRFFVNRI